MLRSDPMSKQCGVVGMGRAPKGSVSQGVGVTNLAWPCPTEIHVWLSLQHRLPMFVGTKLGTWMVDGEKIRPFECEACKDGASR